MSLQLKIALIILAGLVIIAGAIWIAFYWNNSPTEPVVNDDQLINEPVISNPLPPLDYTTDDELIDTTPLTEIEKKEIKVQQLAKGFTERFGSYSNQSNYKNLEDLYDLMTASMERWTKNLVKEMREQHGSNPLIYSGITTKALSVKTVNFNTSQATIKVKTQRQESSDDSPTTKTYYQEISIDLIQVSGEWLIDGAFWQ